MIAYRHLPMNATSTGQSTRTPTKENRSTSALVFSTSSVICRGLLLLLQSLPQLSQIRSASDLETALQICKTDSPVLIVIDAPLRHQACHPNNQKLLDETDNAPYNCIQFAQKIYCKGTESRTVALVNNEQDVSSLLDTKIDAVLLKGVSVARLLATIEDLLS